MVKKKKCSFCKKKIKGIYALTVLECRCKCGQLCKKCYPPDKHNCTFDMKAYHQQILLKKNPQVLPQKITKIN